MLKGPVGIFAFGTSPRQHMAQARPRALLAEAALQGLDLVFFSGPDCDLATGLVEAEHWGSSGWERQKLPLPRIVLIINEPLWPADRTIDAWLRAQTNIIAPHAPGKAELPRLLSGSPLANYLIPQRVLTSDNVAGELAEWLAEHGASIIKPADGMRGGGIHRIEPLGSAWRAKYRDQTYDGTLADVIDHVARAIAGRLRYRQYMVQRYIASVTDDGRPVALRADLNKRPDGGWVVANDLARVGEAGLIVTNVARGGYQAPPSPFLSQRRRRKGEEIHAELHALALAVAAHIDKLPEASIIELGVDVLIDPDDRLWLLEVNSRPESPQAEHERAIHLIAYLRSFAA